MRSILLNHPLLRSESAIGKADIYDDGDRYLVHLEAPGFTGDSFSITATENSLNIEAEHELATPIGFDGKPEQRRINRCFRFAKSIESDQVSASMENGMLTIEVPKRNGRTIEIKVA